MVVMSEELERANVRNSSGVTEAVAATSLEMSVGSCQIVSFELPAGFVGLTPSHFLYQGS
jgi:hypothetical protein